MKQMMMTVGLMNTGILKRNELPCDWVNVPEPDKIPPAGEGTGGHGWVRQDEVQEVDIQFREDWM